MQPNPPTPMHGGAAEIGPSDKGEIFDDQMGERDGARDFRPRISKTHRVAKPGSCHKAYDF